MVAGGKRGGGWVEGGRGGGRLYKRAEGGGVGGGPERGLSLGSNCVES